MNKGNRQRSWDNRSRFVYGLASFLVTLSACWAAETNFFFYTSRYQPQTFNLGNPATFYKVASSAASITEIVQAPTNVIILTNETFATEYEAVAWGYPSAVSAWTSAVACYHLYYMVYSNVYYDNVGWITGTHEAYETWGAFVWFMQDTISFYSSTSSLYISPHGATSEIACVIVGSLGVYNPQTHVTEVGPILPTNYMGEGVTTDAVFKADLSTYYRIVPRFKWKVNDDDIDHDGIPGFADGFNRDGTSGNADDQSPDAFHTWNLYLYNACEPTQATVRITYSSSDPASVTLNGSNYTAASGAFRLWKKNGAQPRNKNSFASGSPGDFVPPGVYLARDLGFTNRAQALRLYVEPVNTAISEVLLFEVDADGPNGPKGYVSYAKINASILEVESIEASCPVADNSPQTFAGHKTDFGDPCAAASPGQTLLVYYDAVVDASFQVEDFDVTLKANVLPSSITSADLSESWAKVEGPNSGSLNRADTFEVKYQNPKVGGVYKFEFDLGFAGCPKSGANLELPLAGAEMLSWLDAEAKSVGSWCSTHKQATINANYSPIPGLTRRKVFETWCSISGTFFDYIFDPVDADGQAPCRRFQPPIGANGQYGYLTINGVVVHGSKINNLMWALFGRYWGYREWELRLGAQVNEISERRQLDTATSQNAIGLGDDLFDLLQSNPSASISTTLTQSSLRTLQDPSTLIEEKLWPAVAPADTGQSHLERPWLPTTP